MQENMIYANSYGRVIAFLIDIIIMILCLIVIPLPFFYLEQYTIFFTEIHLVFFYIILIYSLPVIYHIFFIWRGGATIGMKTMGYEVRSDDGSRISLLKSVFRYFFLYLSILSIVGIVYGLLNKKNKCWHDVVCKTQVIKVNQSYFKKNN